MSEKNKNPFSGTEPPSGVDYGSFSFTVKQLVLASLAESVSHAVPSKGDAALGCFQVRVSSAGLRVAATDQVRTVFATTTAVIAGDIEHTVYIPAKRLLPILREAPIGELEFTVKKNELTVRAGGTSWLLQLPDSSSYPDLADVDSVPLQPYNRVSLLTALRAVRHAICRDASQPALTQVAVSSAGDTMVVTASDRTRLARSPLPDFPLAMAVRSGVLDDLLRLLSGYPGDEVLVGETEGVLVFRAGAVTLTAGKSTSQFPDMDKQLLAPARETNTQKLTVDKAELARAVSRVSITANAKTSAIALRLSAKSITVESRDEGNSAFESVMASWDGTDRVVVVNHAHLADLVSACPSQSCEFLLGPDVGKRLSPLLLTSGDSVQVLTRMPAALLGY